MRFARVLRWVGLCLVELMAGCRDHSATVPVPTRNSGPVFEAKTTPAEWRLNSIRWIDRSTTDQSDAVPQSVPGLALEVTGPVGFGRFTLNSAWEEPNGLPAVHLNDALFPLGTRTHLTAVVQPGDQQVLLRVESAGTESTAKLDVKAPFTQSSIRSELLIQSDVPLGEGREVPVGRWVLVQGQRVVTVTLRVLFSCQPTGPRLKPEIKPPL